MNCFETLVPSEWKTRLAENQNHSENDTPLLCDQIWSKLGIENLHNDYGQCRRHDDLHMAKVIVSMTIATAAVRIIASTTVATATIEATTIS